MEQSGKNPSMNFVLATNSHFNPASKRLYEEAFPPEERPPYRMLLSFERAKFYEIYDGNLFVGLADIVEKEDDTYLFFLAVEERLQNKGYGSKILQALQKRYRNIYLLAEELDRSYANYEERLRRFAFYERNGFQSKHERVKDYGVWYEILYQEKEINASDFFETMRYLLGDALFERYYQNEEHSL